ncbi:AAA family ATPase [Sedimenticola selenatireducens]|uniref:AAA+ ATPase domain-containing protein n=1 Tax=Sedimenticola selenatireducens TaxID=191960 RepID=A0A2N6CWH2_9GAMM|nr:AAA family ATPase [Sedimenticola selenatireducens]PLX61596.1 MAG: hypothetical protein C0630_10575 [Sedimenticola selenatireducens]
MTESDTNAEQKAQCPEALQEVIDDIDRRQQRPKHRVFEGIPEFHKDDHHYLRKFRELANGIPIHQLELDKVVSAMHLLQAQFPWFTPVIDKIFKGLLFRVANGHLEFKFDPILLVGPPGIGKTKFCRELGKSCHVHVQFQSAAGSADNKLFQGTARGWGSTYPSLPLVILQESQVANPIIIVDEIDKLGTNRHNGNLIDTLLQCTEPESSARWYDECLLKTCDISRICWIFTANDASEIPEALRSRLKIVHVDGPSPEHFDVVLEGVLGEFAHGLNIDPRFFHIDMEERAILKEVFLTGSIRIFGRLLESFLARKDDYLRRVAH